MIFVSYVIVILLIFAGIAGSRTRCSSRASSRSLPGVGFPHALSGLNRAWLWLYFFVAAASHGFLDAMTNGGPGVAFFAFR
jgi:hypothetical protein